MIAKDNTNSLYLNHASVALLPDATCNAITNFIRSRQTPFNYRQTLDILSDKLRHLFAQSIDSEAAAISLQPNAATSFSTLALGLDWQAGDEVIIISEEFPSVSRPFITQLEKKGVKIICINQADFYKNPVEEVRRHISKKTRLLASSWVGYTSGIRVDLAALSNLCKTENIFFAVDATQGLGALTLSIQECPIDFLVVSTYKWLLCPLGVGFFHINPSLSKHLSPPITGWLSTPASLASGSNYSAATHTTAQRFENGGRPLIPYVGAIASMELLLKTGLKTISEQTLALSKNISDTLLEMGFKLAHHYTDTNRSGIVILAQHPQNDALFQHLNAHNIQTTYRNNQIRLSPYFYQNTDDFKHLYSTLNKFLQRP